jgi:Protein of unknown function (DUF3108)
MQSSSKFAILCLCAGLVSAGTAPPGLPKVAHPLAEGTWNWVGKTTMGDQSRDVGVTVEVKAVADTWVIRHVVSAPGRPDAIDTAVLDKDTMECIKREAQQGPLSVKLDTKAGKITGTITMGERVMPVDRDAGGALFADGIAARQSIIALPLADGYTATFRTFDLQSMKTKMVELKVAGTEKITVPAGSFEALRIETHALDGTPEPMTLWMDKASRKLVKMTATVGPATISAELK